MQASESLPTNVILFLCLIAFCLLCAHVCVHVPSRMCTCACVLSGMFRRSTSLAIPHRKSFAAILSLSLVLFGTRIAASNCHTNQSVKLNRLGTFKTNSLLPTRRSGGRKAGLCFAAFEFLTFRGPLASHDSNPYPNCSRFARYNATKPVCLCTYLFLSPAGNRTHGQSHTHLCLLHASLLFFKREQKGPICEGSRRYRLMRTQNDELFKEGLQSYKGNRMLVWGGIACLRRWSFGVMA